MDWRKTKVCGACGEIKPKECYHKDKSNIDNYAYTCKACASERNSKVVVPSKKVHPSVALMKEYVASVKLRVGCALCGYKKLARALQFHHITGDKVASISNLIASGVKYSITAEMCKCVVLCANCHSEVHAGLHDTIALRVHLVKIDNVDQEGTERRLKALKLARRG